MKARPIISSYAELPVGIWRDCVKADADETRDPVDRQVAVIALLTHLSEREVLNAPLEEFTEWSARAEYLRSERPEPGRIADAYRIGDLELIPVTDLRKITTAQYIDFQTFAAGGDDSIVELLSVFLVPKGKTYCDGYDPADVQAAIRNHLSVAETVSLCAFFLTKYAALIRTFRSFLTRLAKKETNRRRKAEILRRLKTLETVAETLRDAGVGSPTSTPSARPSAAPGTTSSR